MNTTKIDSHITVITRRDDLRIMYFQAGGARYNLCGAALTSRDVHHADAMRMKENGRSV